jgi:MarR family transcriptional regulator, organic hydroperoxide resistance regulator
MDNHIDINMSSLTRRRGLRSAAGAVVGRSVRATALADEIVMGLRRIVKAIELYSREVQKTYGLTGPQLWALKVLAREGPLSVGKLAEALAVHQSSLSLLVDRLEARGLIRRHRETRDRRVVRLALTSAGAALATRAPEAAQGRLLHALRRMPKEEVRWIYGAVARLVQIMEAEDVEATFFFSDD